MSLYLVTGGAGFIGSHLCDALIARGDRVRVLDDLSTGHRANLPPAADLVVGDVADAATMAAAMEDVAGCFHLAAIASVQRGVTDWLGTHRANLTGTITLLDAIRRTGARTPVVFASSAAVYGDCKTVPIAEDAACAPLSAYGADKYGCELHARVASHVHGIPAIGLRFFNVYGPRQDPRSPYTGVISIFCDRIGRGAPVTIFGDGQQSRDFVYVGDVVSALLAAMPGRAMPGRAMPGRAMPDRAAPAMAGVAIPGGTAANQAVLAPAASFRTYNVCTGHATTVLDLARTIGLLTGGRIEIRHEPPRIGEIRHSLGDRTALARDLCPKPPVPLRDGLARLLAWSEVAA